MLSPKEIKDLREKLDLTQAGLAQLLGVHHLTVSKWERGLLSPSPHQASLLLSFKQARRNQGDIGKVVLHLLAGAGVAVALYTILKAAFGNNAK